MGCGWAVDGGQLDLSDSTGGGVWLSNRKDLMANRVTRDRMASRWTGCVAVGWLSSTRNSQ